MLNLPKPKRNKKKKNKSRHWYPYRKIVETIQRSPQEKPTIRRSVYDGTNNLKRSETR